MTAKPLTIWSARRWIEKTAWMSASRPPNSIAIRSPTTQLPLQTEPQIPKKAPVSIIPSSPMFTTPERSEKIPPDRRERERRREAERRGEDARREDAVEGVRVVALEPDRAERCPRCRGRSPTSRASARRAVPARSRTRRATRPAAIGQPISRVVQGGSASQKASTPKRDADDRDRRAARGAARTPSPKTVGGLRCSLLELRLDVGRRREVAAARARCRRSGARRRRRR